MKQKKIIFEKLTVKETANIRGGDPDPKPGEVPGLFICSNPGGEGMTYNPDICETTSITGLPGLKTC